MSVQVRRRREAAAFLSTYVGAQGELIVDTTNNRVQVHDGITPGGWPAAKLGEAARIARTAIAAPYAALPTDRLVAVTGLVSPIAISLPPAASVQAGARLLIIDETGLASSALAITVAPQGSDVLAGGFASAITTPYGYLELESNTLGQWTMSDGVSAASASLAAGASGSISTPGFSGQATIGLGAVLQPFVIAEPRLKAGMRPILSPVNPLVLKTGVLVNATLTGFAAGEISGVAIVSTFDGRITPSLMTRMTLVLNYHGV